MDCAQPFGIMTATNGAVNALAADHAAGVATAYGRCFEYARPFPAESRTSTVAVAFAGMVAGAANGAVIRVTT